jgi:hypothetical protein
MTNKKPATKNQILNNRNWGNRNFLRRKMVRMGLREQDFVTSARPLVFESH